MRRRDVVTAATFAALASTVGPAFARSADGEVGRERVAALGGLPVSPGSAIQATPKVLELLSAATPGGELARNWLRFLNGIAGREGLTVDDVCTSDVRCIELELAGMGGGIETLRQFRAGMNGSLEEGPTLLEEMVIRPAESVIEVTLHGGGRHIGPIAGVPATGKDLWYDVQTLNYFRGDRMALRWDRTNLMERLQALAAG